MFWTYLACVLIVSAAAEDDSCPDFKGKKDFDLTQFMGTWYEIGKSIPGFGGKCIVITYSLNNKGGFGVVRKAIDKDGKSFTIEGTGVQDVDNKAKQTITFRSRNIVSPYWILDTDYESTALIWRCINGDQSAYLYTRELHPSKSVLEKAYPIFDKIRFNHSSLTNIDRENCPKDT